MTNPDPLGGIALPFSVVLRPQASGFQNLIITSGKPRVTQWGAQTHQFNLPRGVCIVQLEWTCSAAVNLRWNTQVAAESSQLVILPQASASNPRTEVLRIPVESDDGYMYFQQQWGGREDDLMMVTVYPTPPAP